LGVINFISHDHEEMTKKVPDIFFFKEEFNSESKKTNKSRFGNDEVSRYGDCLGFTPYIRASYVPAAALDHLLFELVA
jgi:hypothetical protein